MTIIKIKTKRWKDDEITKCSSEQNLRKKSMLAWRTKVKLQEVELHLGNDGILPLFADWPEGRWRFEVGQKKEFVFKV